MQENQKPQPQSVAPGSSSAAAKYAPLAMWVVYQHPKDDRDAFVARRWEMHGGAMVATATTMRDPTLEELQRLFRARGLFRLPRAPADDPVIVEVWL